MGKKSDELREELDLANIERIALERQVDELKERLQHATNLAAAQVGAAMASTGMTPESLMRSGAMEPLRELVRDDYPGRTALGVRRGGEMAAEAPEASDQPEPESTLAKADHDDLQAIRELHRPPPQLDKAETSLDVVRANNAERASLQSSTRQNNALISRIASAMRVDRWDADGTEILEKCQRWANFSYWVKRRQKLATGPVANELGTVLAALEAPQDLAKWIMDKTGDVAPELVVDVAQAPTGHKDGVRDVTRDDLQRICHSATFRPIAEAARDFVKGTATMKDLTDGIAKSSSLQDEPAWLAQTLKSERATAELLNYINLVLLPYLRNLQGMSGAKVGGR